MNATQTLRVISIVMVTTVVAGCSSSGTLQMKQASTQTISPGKSVALSVEALLPPDAGSELREEAALVVQEMRVQLFGRLMSEGFFSQVLQSGDPADYRLDVQVTDAEEVSQGARIFFGTLAGANSLTALVELHDQGSNQIVSEFVVTGSSASHPMSSENDLEDAIREAVAQIMHALR